MEEKIKKYIGNLGLSHLKWELNSEECEDDFCMAIIDHDGMLGLEVVNNSFFESSDQYNNWMSADDIGWSGPVRGVVAWIGLGL